MTNLDFTGKRVLVTGASRGVGLGVARGFAAAGAELTIQAPRAFGGPSAMRATAPVATAMSPQPPGTAKAWGSSPRACKTRK